MDLMISTVLSQVWAMAVIPVSTFCPTSQPLGYARKSSNWSPGNASFVKIGGLVFYGVDRTELFRESASYVDRILRGERAGDLPFQEPTKYELSINRRTAIALGLNIP